MSSELSHNTKGENNIRHLGNGHSGCQQRHDKTMTVFQTLASTGSCPTRNKNAGDISRQKCYRTACMSCKYMLHTLWKKSSVVVICVRLEPFAIKREYCERGQTE